MQTSYSSSRILLAGAPVVHRLQPAARAAAELPADRRLAGVPDWLALVIVFWSVREPRRVGMGLAFLFGLAMDVADASCSDSTRWPMSWLPTAARRCRDGSCGFRSGSRPCRFFRCSCWCSWCSSACAVVGADSPGISYFLGPCLATLLWPLLTFVLLLPQHQPVDRDANRPL
jgi:rod shape-determining protein MreD